ncbi:UvrABC system protein A [compost metagenome]
MWLNIHNIGSNSSYNTTMGNVICGVSGSDKSSLAMDVLYTEGFRRYLESLST